jgi:hypothetical protein
VLIFAGIAWFYTYIGIPPQYAVHFPKTNADYYNLLVEGFLSGRTNLKTEPPAALRALADPYDPAQRATVAEVVLHDAVYYQGRYYLYFGVAPALTVFLPFKALTGLYFPQNLATVLLCVGGYFCSLGLMLALRRRFFPQADTGWVWLAAVLLGLGNFCAPMLARNGVWEVPIASAYFYSSLGFWLLFTGWRTTPRRLSWWWLASVAFGLAIASRPHFIFLAAGLGVLWLGLWWRESLRSGRWAFKVIVPEALALYLPLGLIIAGLLVYNEQRFGQPFEFGIRYQLGGYSVLHATLTSWRFFPINFYLEFLAPSQIQRYFPFFNVIRGYQGVRPLEWGGAEDPYGLLTNMPFSWLALLAPLVWVAGFRRQRDLGGWVFIFGWGFLGVALPVLCFGGACNRYMVDFIPPLLLLALLGGLMLSRLAAGWRFGRGLVHTGIASLVAYTAIFNVFVAFQHHGFFATYRPGAFATLSRICNAPVLWWEARHPETYGPVELTVRFSKDHLGGLDPLLVTGVSYQSDYLYVRYLPDGTHVQLGYTRTNHEQVVSQPIPIDYYIPHRIGIVSGALYPPAWHPYFSGRTPEEVRAAKETFLVTMDGVPYLAGRQEFFDTTPGFVHFGENTVSSYVSPKLTGEVLAVRRQPLSPPVADFPGGSFMRLALRLPKAPAGQRESIVTTGGADQGDVLFLVYQSATSVQLGFHHGGEEPILSQPIVVRPDEVQLLEVSFGSFYTHPRNGRERELAQMLVVKLNDQSVWSESRKFHPAGLLPFGIGGNLRWKEAGTAAFSGMIVACQPVPLPPSVADSPFVFLPYWIDPGLQPAYGAMRLWIELPRDLPLQPLLVSGPSREQADYLLISSPVARQISLTYVHTNAAAVQSRFGQVDVAKPQVIEIELPSLYPPESDEFFAASSLSEIAAYKSRARFKVNGSVVFDANVLHYDATARQVTIGEDKLGQTFGPRFTGKILSVDRSSLARPPGFDTNDGPLELELTFPQNLAMESEAILATGDGRALDILLLMHDGPQQAHFVLKTAGGTTLTGPPVRIDSAATQKVRVTWGGFYPDSLRPAKVSPEEWRQRQHTVAVSVNGAPGLSGQADFVLAARQTVSIGQIAAKAGAVSGRLHGVRRLPLNAR